MKLVVNKAGTIITLKNGRTNVWKVTGILGLTRNALEGLVAAQNADEVTQEQLEAAIEAAKAKSGSVIPDGYRHNYGVDQNCGDDIATRLKKATTGPDGKADMDKVEQIAAQNDVADRFDVWVSKGLNNGMVRMNLGNVLRGKARRGDEVTI